jgi:hypothetical protein
MALFKAHRLTKDKKYLNIAFKTLYFLEKNYTLFGYPSPVGQKKWYQRDGKKCLFDQQAIEAADMTMLYNELFNLTGEKKYKDKALSWFGWFYGNNINNVMLFNQATEGVYDGLTKKGINLNQGAESIIKFLMAYISFSRTF